MGEDATPPIITIPEVERRIQVVNNTLNATPAMWGDAALYTTTELGLLELERVIRAIRDKHGENRTKEKLKQQLEAVIRSQELIGKDLAELDRIFVEKQFKKEPEIGTVGPAFLTKGEAKKVRHTINWRQYDKDELVLKLTVTDNKDKKPVPADVLGVATELKLDFEKNQTFFEYDVKAGAKEGEYTLTLTPAVGDPVTVIVTVK